MFGHDGGAFVPPTSFVESVFALALTRRARAGLVHLARLVLELDTNRTLTITTPNGHPINTTIARRALRLPAPDDPTRITALGEHMDIDACLTAIHQYARATTHAA